MKNVLLLIGVVVISCFVAAIYGILHDQLTYTISHEYYTKFKFYQFGIKTLQVDYEPPEVRLWVALVGVLATWWMGIPIGLILGLVGFVHKGNRRMFQVVMKAILITVVVAFITGLIGLAYGKLYLSKTDVDWWLPENLIDKKSFITVGSMHNFSYLGGLIGMITGIAYILKQKSEIQVQNSK